MIGQLRMQFWRDAIKSFSDVRLWLRSDAGTVVDRLPLQGSPPRHPIALALYDACQRTHLPAYHLKRIIDARVRSPYFALVMLTLSQFLFQGC